MSLSGVKLTKKVVVWLAAEPINSKVAVWSSIRSGFPVLLSQRPSAFYAPGTDRTTFKSSLAGHEIKLKALHNRNSLMLCFTGGLFMIASGASGAIGTLSVIGEHIANLFGPGFEMTFDMMMDLLSTFTLLGGVIVIISGLVLTTRSYTLGRVLLFVSIGIGVAGLVMCLVQLALSGSFMLPLTLQLAQSVGWVGAILSLIAWNVAEQPSVIASE